jgi:hypothetical protein
MWLKVSLTLIPRAEGSWTAQTAAFHFPNLCPSVKCILICVRASMTRKESSRRSEVGYERKRPDAVSVMKHKACRADGPYRAQQLRTGMYLSALLLLCVTSGKSVCATTAESSPPRLRVQTVAGDMAIGVYIVEQRRPTRDTNNKECRLLGCYVVWLL